MKEILYSLFNASYHIIEFPFEDLSPVTGKPDCSSLSIEFYFLNEQNVEEL
jgi:hypothetical protein